MSKIVRNQEEIAQAARVLAALGQGDDFNRGVVALAEMLKVKRHWSLKSRGDITAAARSLLAQELSGDFARGVLSLAGALVPIKDLEQLRGEVATLREMMPARDIRVDPMPSFFRDAIGQRDAVPVVTCDPAAAMVN